jgi:hypothetical protein
MLFAGRFITYLIGSSHSFYMENDYPIRAKGVAAPGFSEKQKLFVELAKLDKIKNLKAGPPNLICI